MKETIGSFAWSVYGVAFLLVVFPLVEVTLGAWPLRVGDVAWRCGFVGLFSRAFITPLLGVLLALLVGVISQHRTFARLLAIACLTWAGLAVAMVGLYFLDSLQVYGTMPLEARPPFIAATLMAFGRYGVGSLTSLALGVAGLRSLRAKDGGQERVHLVMAPGSVVKKDAEADSKEVL